jgi:hypothetical protein
LLASSEDESSSSSSRPSWNVGFFVGVGGSAAVLPPFALAWRAVIAGEFMRSLKFVFWPWCKLLASALWLEVERRRGRLPRGA